MDLTLENKCLHSVHSENYLAQISGLSNSPFKNSTPLEI